MKTLKSSVPTLSKKEKSLISSYCDEINAEFVYDNRRALVVLPNNVVGFIQRSDSTLLDIVFKDGSSKTFVRPNSDEVNKIEEFAAIMGYVIDWMENKLYSEIDGSEIELRTVGERVFLVFNQDMFTLKPTRKKHISVGKALDMAYDFRQTEIVNKDNTIMFARILQLIVRNIKG